MERNREISTQSLVGNLTQKADLLYKFVTLYNNYINSPRDYGTGNFVTMIEVHTLTEIHDNPGITVTQLAQIWNRTKSAVSQTVKKLEERGFIYRIINEQNRKIAGLYPTQEGEALSAAHKSYDRLELTQTLEELLKYCSYEEIDTFYKVIELYLKMLEE